MSDFPSELKGTKCWRLISQPIAIDNCDDDSLNNFIYEHTHENGVLCWGSMKSKKTKFNAMSSKVNIIYYCYYMKCNEYWKMNDNTSKHAKSKCVQRKFFLNNNRTHIGIYQTTNSCMGAQTSPNYVPKRGFKISDKVNIKHAYSVSGNMKVIANDLTSQGIDRVVVNKRLDNFKQSLKVDHSTARKRSLEKTKM